MRVKEWITCRGARAVGRCAAVPGAALVAVSAALLASVALAAPAQAAGAKSPSGAFACHECIANIDPDKVPVHPGCHCSVITTDLDMGISDEHLYEEAEQGGFTVNVLTGNEPITGYSVSAHPERSVVIPTREFRAADLGLYVQKNADLLQQQHNHLGAWREVDKAKGIDRIWLDVSTVEEREEAAITMAQKANQIAIYDLAHGETISTGGYRPVNTRKAA